MANISSLGVGSGLQAESLVSQLMTLESQPMVLLNTKEAAVNAKISAFGSIKSLLDSLATASGKLGNPNKLAAFKATSSASDIANATATGTASAGSYNVNVLRLASAHKVSNTTAIAGTSAAVIGAGDFTMTLGSGTPVTVTLGAGATLGDLRDAINNSTAGVTANIVTGQNGGSDESRLILTAKETGQAISTSTTLAGFGSFQTVGGPHTVTTNTAFSGPSDIVGQGTLAITVGGTTTNVAAGAGASLQNVADAINGTSGVGVTASVVTDTTGTRLKLVAQDPSLLVSYTAVDDNATDGYDFSRLRGFSTVGSQPQVPQTALLEIDGQSITSASNTITSAIAGVSLNLTKVGTTTLSIARDKDAVKTSVDEFIKGYNDLNTKIRSLTAYDATNKKANTLTGDSTARNIQNQLSSILIGSPGTASGAYSRLADIGISIGKDGSLSVDSSKLQSSIDTDFASVNSVLNRYGNAMNTKATEFTSSSGLLSGKTTSLASMIKDYDNRKESLQLRLDAIEKRYRAQYSALDTMISSMQGTASYLTQQLSLL
ncbi:MAG: flagellar hook-associated 2 domain protein [Proteobacteria bacterium]|nr:flagellar hook-associated 2 domain protein [Pseudomonadota bacterium]